MQNTLRVGLVQQHNTQDSGHNLEQAIEGIKAAAKQRADLIVLQELTHHLYFCQHENSDYFNLAETIPGPTTDVLSLIAKDLQVVIVGSLFEQRCPGIYHNTAVVIDKDGTLAGCYRKMHIPDDPGYYEKYYFTPGDLGFKPIATSVGQLGVLICWDQWFPEAARLMALNGAEILIYPTAIGWDPNTSDKEKNREKDAWITVQRAHAICNHLPVICCNRTGFESDPSGHTDGIAFWGQSFIAAPGGQLIAQAPTHQSCVIVEQLKSQSTTELRRQWPFLRDRRIDCYHGLLERYIN